MNLLSALGRRKGWIIGTTMLSLLAAVLFLVTTPPRYTARVQMLIDPSDLRVMDNVVTPRGDATEAGVMQVESQVRVLGSDTVLRRIVERERLAADPEFNGEAAAAGLQGLVRRVRAALLPADATSIELEASAAALRNLSRQVSVRRTERTFVVDVAVTAQSGPKAARLANAIAQAYLEDQAEIRADVARRATSSLSARLGDLRDRVREAETRLQDFRAKNDVLLADGRLLNEQQLSELNEGLVAARTTTATAQARYDQIQELRRSRAVPGAIADAVASPRISALRS